MNTISGGVDHAPSPYANHGVGNICAYGFTNHLADGLWCGGQHDIARIDEIDLEHPSPLIKFVQVQTSYACLYILVSIGVADTATTGSTAGYLWFAVSQDSAI